MKTLLCFTLSLAVSATVHAAETALRLTEFMAVNASTVTDKAGNRPDWIEIHNSGDAAISLEGLFLTDDLAQPKKWPFPAKEITGKEYLLVFASGENRYDAVAGEMHANFKLAKEEGGYLGLVTADGLVAQALENFPEQQRDIAFGLGEVGKGYLLPTPKAANGGVLLGFVEDTKFGSDRGFYEQAFDLTITTATPEATIVYTTDGRLPGLGNVFTGPIGKIYTGPVRLEKSTIVRAAAFREGYAPSNVDTHTYLFLADVIRQPKAPEGFPAKWATATADYAMDPRVVDDAAYKNEMIPALKSIPTMSVVMEPDDLFHASKGIYAQSEQRGAKWEKPASIEYIRPDGKPGFRETCGIRIHGFGWRAHSVQWKHSLRLEFSERYGKKKLDYPLFPDAPVEKFDSIVIRSQGSKGWQDFRDPTQTQYIHDSFARDLSHEMGRPVETHATYVHLYLNGLYWGLYNPVERPDDDFAAEYYGGQPESYDVVNRRTSTNEAIAGNLIAYNKMLALARAGLETPEKYAVIQEYIDVDDLIDYMLVHQYTTNRDGPQEFDSNNMRGIRQREPGGQFRFFVWDMEYSMWNADRNININVAIANSASFVYAKMRDNPEFRLRYADRVHRHCFNTGAMTPTRARQIWDRRSDEIYSALLGESARWGDAKRPTKPYTRDVEWAAERKRLIETYFPRRTEFLVKQLTTAKLYPTIAAPTFSQHGGQIPSGYLLAMNSGSDSQVLGELYYTTDGSDPRVIGSGEISATATKYARDGAGVALNQSSVVQARVLADGQWSALNSATFVVGKTATRESLLVSEVHYHPAAASEEEKAAGFSANDFEFIELANVGQEPIDLTTVRLAQGAKAMWLNPRAISLAPGAATVAVRNRAAFEKRYGKNIAIWAEFTRADLADGGETLAVAVVNGTVLHEFLYNDKKPWPKEADGDGPSLVLASPRANPDLSKPESWAASIKVGGTPGLLEEGAAPDPNLADLDGDGLNAFLEAAFGTSDRDATAGPSAVTVRHEAQAGGSVLTLEVPRSPAAKDIVFQVETSADLKSWSDASAAFERQDADATRVRFVGKSPVSQSAARFLRLKVSRG